MSLTDVINPVELELPPLTSKVSGTLSDVEFEQQAHIMIELSILAYVSTEKAEKWGYSIGFPEVKRIAYDGDQAATIFSNDNDIVISFRGTYNINNFIEDMDYKLTMDGRLPGLVHSGFLSAFNELWPSVSSLLDSTKNIWVTGHSLGGAIAAIAAVKASRRDAPNISGLFTFGQPRIGDFAYVSDLFTPSNRWVNHHDLIPQLPTVWMGFSHFGRENYIDSEGCVITHTFGVHMKRIVSRLLGLLKYNLEDHDIYKYRNAILKSNNQESANDKR